MHNTCATCTYTVHMRIHTQTYGKLVERREHPGPSPTHPEAFSCFGLTERSTPLSQSERILRKRAKKPKLWLLLNGGFLKLWYPQFSSVLKESCIVNGLYLGYLYLRNLPNGDHKPWDTHFNIAPGRGHLVQAFPGSLLQESNASADHRPWPT